MLGHIRESIQGWIAIFIVALLIVPFALWGINEYFGTGGRVVVATVNGEEISQASYQQAYQNQRLRMQQMLGAQFDPAMFDAQMKKQALDDLVDREVLFQYAEDKNFRVSNQTVIGTIQSIEAFQEGGQFSNDAYKRALSAQGETPAGFEQRIKKAILTQQLYSGLTSTSLTTQHEVNTILSLQEQKRDISYVILPVAKFKNEALATEVAIADYYEKNKARYMTPEKVVLEYVELNGVELAKDEIPDEQMLKQFYQERSSLYKVPEERRTRHILVAVDEGADEAKVNEARAKAQDLRKRILEGESFEKMAEENSDDPGSSKLGGDIGFFGKDALDPAYEKTMFAMNVGDVSEPVLSSFGFHIIKLEEVRAEQDKPFEEVKDSLISEYQQNQAEKKFFELSDKLTTLAYEVSDTLQDAAAAINAQIKTTPAFSQSGGAGIASNAKVRSLAFGEEVLKNGYNSEPVSLGDNHVVVFRVKEHFPEVQQPLEEVKDMIKNQLISDEAKTHAKEVGKNIIERLNKDENIDSVLAEIIAGLKSNESENATDKEKDKQGKTGNVSIEWKNAGALDRNSNTINNAIVKQAFALKKPDQDKKVYDGVELPNGDYAVFAVNAVIDTDVEKIDEAKRLTLKRNLTGAKGDSAFSNALTLLKGNVAIKIEEDNL